MDIYEKHRATFRNVSAYVILHGAQRVATIAFKSGATEQAFVHWIGRAMVRASAGGGGYDRQSAACAKAARAAELTGDSDATRFWAALEIDGGAHWYQELERAGFTVLQAV